MPCAHGLVKMGATKTTADVAAKLAQAGCEVGLSLMSVSDIVLARNRLSSRALALGYSHVFFIDSDMSFPASLALAMVEANKDVIGLVYPRRELSLERLIDVGRANPDMPYDAVISTAQEYVVRLGANASFTDGIGRVEGLGMGGTLIKTSVLQTMVDEGLVEERRERTKSDADPWTVWGFFDLVTKPDGLQFGEDYSFCARWTGRGGEIWGVSAPGVQHVGDFYFSGDLIAGRGTKHEPEALPEPPKRQKPGGKPRARNGA
jgi:hypothetical protein